jgi:hypothetical protein
VAILATVFISRSNHEIDAGRDVVDATLSGYHWGFVGASIIFLIGAVWSWTRIRDTDAARTMRPRPRASAT